jgi:hypothetical protein
MFNPLGLSFSGREKPTVDGCISREVIIYCYTEKIEVL